MADTAVIPPTKVVKRGRKKKDDNAPKAPPKPMNATPSARPIVPPCENCILSAIAGKGDFSRTALRLQFDLLKAGGEPMAGVPGIAPRTLDDDDDGGDAAALVNALNVLGGEIKKLAKK
ncbi:hypothetical protein Trco_008200 [Trichoderma cornu-damae]|uniref:Uncharacterized protein n=1 Tax=Trichoderma cornu-damae TaxID=654480 RepID=A0A9P8QDV9_9HYPO|nr:hypothetical protein Trco_008200 [Trichoderma cornu-damae]